ASAVKCSPNESACCSLRRRPRPASFLLFEYSHPRTSSMRSLITLLLSAAFVVAAEPPAVTPFPNYPTARPGPTKDGFLLPNGWHLTPAGKHIVTADLPLNILPLKDNRHALVGTCGFNPHHLSLVDIVEGKVIARETVIQSWYGMAVSADEKKVWWS